MELFLFFKILSYLKNDNEFNCLLNNIHYIISHYGKNKINKIKKSRLSEIIIDKLDLYIQKMLEIEQGELDEVVKLCNKKKEINKQNFVIDQIDHKLNIIDNNSKNSLTDIINKMNEKTKIEVKEIENKPEEIIKEDENKKMNIDEFIEKDRLEYKHIEERFKKYQEDIYQQYVKEGREKDYFSNRYIYTQNEVIAAYAKITFLKYDLYSVHYDRVANNIKKNNKNYRKKVANINKEIAQLENSLKQNMKIIEKRDKLDEWILKQKDELDASALLDKMDSLGLDYEYYEFI
jgi:hypothetical protein